MAINGIIPQISSFLLEAISNSSSSISTYGSNGNICTATMTPSPCSRCNTAQCTSCNTGESSGGGDTDPSANMAAAVITGHDRDATSITIYYRNYDSYATSEALYASSSYNGGYGRHSTLSTSSGSHSITISVGDYKPRYFYVKRYNSTVGELDSDKYEVEEYIDPRPDKFYWSSAVSSGKEFSGLTASEWNSFINKILETFAYYGYGYDYTLSTSVQSSQNLPQVGFDISYYEMTQRLTVSSGQTFRATYFNAVRFMIGSFVATGLSTKYAGDIIYASDFIKLQDCLNSWIGG